MLLNYRLGDLATMLTERCPCGRSLPLLSALHGRRDELIEVAPGRTVHPMSIRRLFTQEEQIWQYQVRQESPNRFRVSLVTAPSCDRPAAQERLTDGFRAHLGPDVVTEIVFVDSIDRTPGGKVQPVIALAGRSGA